MHCPPWPPSGLSAPSLQSRQCAWWGPWGAPPPSWSRFWSLRTWPCPSPHSSARRPSRPPCPWCRSSRGPWRGSPRRPRGQRSRRWCRKAGTPPPFGCSRPRSTPRCPAGRPTRPGRHRRCPASAGAAPASWHATYACPVCTASAAELPHPAWRSSSSLSRPSPRRRRRSRRSARSACLCSPGSSSCVCLAPLREGPPCPTLTSPLWNTVWSWSRAQTP
mmetsp:Transcript_16366/g.46708  ORF Transcript_16366/g.46708 Transcript_16366/m.46708 type:complete len:219 (+) Transcript_16366:127-783(+)